MALRRKPVQYERVLAVSLRVEALLSQHLPGECWCAPVSTGTELVRKPTGIYWVKAQTLTHLSILATCDDEHQSSASRPDRSFPFRKSLHMINMRRAIDVSACH